MNANTRDMHRFFNVREHSTNITLTKLKLILEQKWGLYPNNEYDAAGINLGHVSNVRISNIDMHFKATPSSLTAGIYVAMDVGAHTVDIRDLSCIGVWGGALVNLKSNSINLPAPDSSDTI
jgi:hypothetical protein